MLPHLLKNLGFHVSWLSNQGKFGEHLNLTSLLASTSSETKFINNADFASTSYDERLIPLFQEELRKKRPKVIFLHLLGSHFMYDRRYPIEFDRFKKQDVYRKNVKLPPKKALIVNQYDNTILYTDHILAKIINILNLEKGPASLTYFSDHGEILYEVRGKDFGHGGGIPTDYELEVPFFIWYNTEFAQKFSSQVQFLSNKLSKDFSLVDFIPLYLNFLNVKSNIDIKYNEDQEIYYYDGNGKKGKL